MGEGVEVVEGGEGVEVVEGGEGVEVGVRPPMDVLGGRAYISGGARGGGEATNGIAGGRADISGGARGRGEATNGRAGGRADISGGARGGGEASNEGDESMSVTDNEELLLGAWIHSTMH